MRQKRIMMLGGNYFQMTATLAAKRMGYYVISVDYLPDNPAHKYADEYHNISTIDKERVLEKARELQIDGIVSYASDVSAPTAAYVAEALGLPTNPYESVMIMTHKNEFRAFLRENGFPMPKGESFTDKEEARAFCSAFSCSAMLKPVDSCGSKGVCRIDSMDQFDAAWEEARSYSMSKRIIVEEHINRREYQIDGDMFVDHGEIVFWGICDQHHDFTCSPYVPTGHTYPPVQEQKYQDEAKRQIRKLLKLLGMHMGTYNVEYVVGDNDQVYLLEIGPRSGGNLITDAVAEATGISLAEALVRQAVGDDVSYVARQVPRTDFAAAYIIHSLRDGRFKEMKIAPELEPHIVRSDLFIKPGEEVSKFRNASFAIGAMLLRFDSSEQMLHMIDQMNDYLEIVVE